MLRSLKSFADQLAITGIIAMSDSGGSSGFLRKKYGVLPPGDILRAVLALSSYDSEMLKEIFYQKRFPSLTKFCDEPKNAPNLGNILLAFLQRGGDGILTALAVLEESFKTVGSVFPITIEHTHLCAELSDGTFTTQECDLDKPNFSHDVVVKRLWIEPESEAYEPALKAIREADFIFFGPGDLYTSVIATLLPGGVWRALSDSKAEFIQVVARSKHRHGEPSPSTLGGIVREMQAYLPRPVDMVLYNNAIVSGELLEVYAQNGWAPIEHDVKEIEGMLVRGADFEDGRGGYSWKKMNEIIRELLGIMS